MECKCIVPWCDRVQNKSGKGYCRKHYDQMRKIGHISDERTRCDKNRFYIVDDVAHIIITNGKDEMQGEALVDADRVEDVIRFRWTLNGHGYVRTFDHRRPIYLHRLLTNYDGDLVIDHINRNKLDNRSSNLRIVSQTVNNLNRKNSCVTEIKGRNLSKPFVSIVTANGKVIFREYFSTHDEAIDAAINFKRSIGAIIV